MRVRKIDTGSSHDARQFTNLPFRINKDYPLWVPTLASEMTLVMNQEKHPYYRHSEADFFLAESDGQALGRIAVLNHRLYSEHHHSPTAFFYYFDCVNDREVSGRLFEAAFDWARERGLTLMLGPKGFSRSSGQGLLVEGFQYTPAVGIPYNPPYYPALIEAAGFEKETDHLSGYLRRGQTIPERVIEVAEKVKQRNHFWIKTFQGKAEMRAWIPKIDVIHQEAFQNNPGYYPSTKEEFELLAGNMIQIADPRLVKLIMHGEEVAGFMLCYANISNAIRKARGRIYPLGWVYILWEMRHTKAVDLNGIGLLPKYQGLGSNALLYAEVEKTLLGAGMDQAEIVQVDERNLKSRSDMETVGVQWCKRHRTYRMVL